MSEDQDRIEQLHRRDEEAAKRQDLAALNQLMSEDIVLLPPGGNLSLGKPSLDDENEKPQPTAEILDYQFDWRELKILGNYAWEWGYVFGRERNLESGEITAERYHVMRILQKQADGEWKVHRSIWNEAGDDSSALPT